MKMISYLKRQGLYEVSIGAGEESYEEPSDQLNDYDRAIGGICLAISPCMRYLIDSIDSKGSLDNIGQSFGKGQ